LLDGQQGRRAQALTHLDQAERFYRAASHVEGETEVLLRRGVLLAGANEFVQARSSLERALALASGLKNRSQQIRAQLAASALTAAEGRLGAAEEQATSAVKLALAAGLDVVAANGLIDLAGTLMQRRYLTDAAPHLTQAIDLSERRRAHRTALRAKVTLASLTLDQGRAQEAIGLAEGTLDALRSRGYRRWELTALLIASRGHEFLGNYDRARAVSREVLHVAESLNDDSQIATALENLAGQAAAQGLLADALRDRERQEEIHRRQGDMANLAFDLQNRAELLIRLGRGREAEALLAEIDKHAAAGLDAFASRGRRVKFLRAFRATVEERFDDAAQLSADVVRASGSNWDSTALTAFALLEHAMAHGVMVPIRLTVPSPKPSVTPRVAREIRYWEIAALAAQRQFDDVLDGVLAQLADESTRVSGEFRWRIAALGAAAAQQQGNQSVSARLSADATKALDELRPALKEYVADYLTRPDLARLRRQAGLHGEL
jgi:tetratricopeptide (TPR) repeat protein